ncbi:CPBP family intramembrane metalloprotease [Synechococcus sp. Nb3U1]|uniref:CPBP family intramembrane glutamic endopeptidase n=1 Tax=Synechococcus sp. Nb3U1 TaxID=1914529 RepID=UPI001F24031F|nr:type II CAAX endopeptidase family protein [Synechococcus sp. Nb3U1]MCF2970560.1 CPBP family intramembrane metalloprotease [Synechococcus sp. Nb3U1]
MSHPEVGASTDPSPAWLSLRHGILNLLSLLALLIVGLSLSSSWFQPPPRTQLDLFQTNLSLQASRTLDDPRYQDLARALLGQDVFKLANNRYQQTAENYAERLKRLKRLTQLAPTAVTDAPDPEPTEPPPVDPVLLASMQDLQTELDALWIRSGLLYAYQEDLEAAEQQWQQVLDPERPMELESSQKAMARILQGLWATPRRILPEAEVQIRNHLDGWFEAVALQQLYRLQQRSDSLNALNQQQEKLALSALFRLAIVGGIPVLGALLGLLLLVGWVGWSLWHKQPLLGPAWEVPWPGSGVQAVLTGWFLGFIALNALVPQLYVIILGLQTRQLSPWHQAVALFLTYNSGALLGAGLLYRLLHRYPTSLLRVRLFGTWLLWGLCGYLVALPLVVLAAALSQLLLPQAGGGNPILPLLLDSRGWGARLVFFAVVSLCAPIFEEVLFRGFWLPALSRYLPMWGAVLVSAFTFALAHLNLSDLLPLTMLGIVLGVIYSHSRNLLAPILLHSLWNTGSLITLLVLGGSR